MKQKLIEKAINNGHLIADKLRQAKTVSDIDDLSKEIDEYSEFVDEYFGTVDEYGEKNCELSALIYMAAEEKARQIEYHPDKKQAGETDIEYFEQSLKSKGWIKTIKNAGH